MVLRNTRPSENSCVKINRLHMYQGSPLIPIFRALMRSLHRTNTSSQEHSLSFSQHFSYPMPLLLTTPLVQLLLHIDTSWSLSPILYCSAHCALQHLCTPRSISLIHFVYHIPFTSFTCHFRPQVLSRTEFL